MGQPPRLQAVAAFCAVFFGALIHGMADAVASSEPFAYESAVDYCRGNVSRPIALSDDRNIVCFDGDILPGLDTSSVRDLRGNGLFVVRSTGGHIETAIALARLVRDVHATVVVYDYCISACAAYLFVASDRTMVRRQSIVAWHLNYAGCNMIRPFNDGGPKVVATLLCAGASEQESANYHRIQRASLDFYRERSLQPSRFWRGLDFPQSYHVRRIVKSLLDETGDIPQVNWMWNPRYYKAIFKTTIIYEAYPESQDEADEIAAPFGLGRVIHDP
jgi:hypothetical protein